MRISDWSSDVCSSDLAVESLADLPVVLQAELRPSVQRLALRPLVGHRLLALRQRDADHIDVVPAGEEQAEPAPAGADVQHLLSGPEQQLGGAVRLLALLRELEAVVRHGEVAAGILPVDVAAEL